MRPGTTRVLAFLVAVIGLGLGVYLLERCRATPWLVWFGLSALFAAVAVRRWKLALASVPVVGLALLLYNGVLAGQSCNCKPGDKDCDRQCPSGYCCYLGTCTPNDDPHCGGGGDEPPSVSGTVLCDQWGFGGWCRSNARLRLSASDPQGYAVTIRGELNGAAFNCGAACTLELPLGRGTARYTATSSSGLTASGSTSWAYDPELPVPGLEVSGTAGENGWYISPVSLAASGSDALSGLAGASLFVDGGAEQSTTVLGDGVHQVVVRVLDGAGNLAEQAFLFQVDTTTPWIDVEQTGTSGANGWYVSAVEVRVQAGDATSGVAALEASVDGGSWAAVNGGLTVEDGVHTVQFRARDLAGNASAAEQSIAVDTRAPGLVVTPKGVEGSNGWYVSPVTVSASASDPEPGSGLQALTYALDGGAWTPYVAPLTLSDGEHTLNFRAVDEAGNMAEVVQGVRVDTVAPVVEMPAGWEVGQAAAYAVRDAGSGLAGVRVVIEDEDERYPKVVWDEGAGGAAFEGEIAWDGRWRDGAVARPGEYLVWVKAVDVAGNEGVQLGRVSVLASFDLFSLILPPTRTPPVTPTAREGRGAGGNPPGPTRTPRVTPTALPTATVVLQAPVTPSRPPVTGRRLLVGGEGNGLKAAPLSSRWPLVAGVLAAIAAAAYAARKRKQQEEEGPSDYQRRIRAKKLAALEAEWERQRAAAPPPPVAPEPRAPMRSVEAKLARLEAEDERRWQQAHPPKPAFDMARWKERDYAESARWQAQQAYQSYRAGERTSYEPPAQPGSWWQRAGEAITHPVQTLENVLVDWGSHSRFGYKVISGLTHLTAPMNDPQRNPVTAAFGKALRDGIDGFVYGVRSTLNLGRQTFSSLLKGDWDGVKRYGGALAEGVVKGWIWGSIQTVGHLAWGVVKAVTPIGLLETGPAWWNAIKDRWAGKRGGWDVAFTTLLLAANLLGIAGAVNGVQTQVTRAALVREYGPAVRPLLAEEEVIPLLKSGEPAPKPWTEYVPVKYQEQVFSAFDRQAAIAVQLDNMTMVYRYWGDKAFESGSPWYTLDPSLEPGFARSLFALPEGNSAVHVSQFAVPENTVIVLGKAASQVGGKGFGSYAIGGGIQVYVPDPSIVTLIGRIR